MKKQKKSLARRRRPTEPCLVKGKKGQKEKACKHQWAALMAQRGKKVIAVPSAKICLKCGLLQVGTETIRISRFRLDMGGLPLRSIGKLQIPVGTDLWE